MSLSDAFIQACVADVTGPIAATAGGRLDTPVNSVGGGYNMPVSDIDATKAPSLFDLNV